MGQSQRGAEQESPGNDLGGKPSEQAQSDSRATSSTAASRTDRRPTEFAQDYLSRFVGQSPRSRGSNDRSAQSRILEERAASAMSGSCCSLPIVNLSELQDRSITSATNGKQVRTDFCSLIDVNGDGSIECGEVVRAICMVDPEFRTTGPDVSTWEGVGYLNVNHRRDDTEVQLTGDPASLEVPALFKGISYDWAAPSGSQRPPTPAQQERLQNCMKPFIQSMLIGVLVRLRLEPGEAPDGDPGGQSIDATLRLNEDLTLLSISAGSAERSIPIKAMRSVKPPDKGRDSAKCVDLRLAGSRFVRFHFDQQAQAKFFGTCMRLLVKAARSNMATPSVASTPKGSSKGSNVRVA